MKVNSGYYIIINKCHGGLFMNKNIKTLLNVLPIILIPLFTERKHIKEHPDIEKLGHFSSNTYNNVKDKGEGAYQSVKATSSNVYQTSKSAVDTVGSKISDKRQERSYKKDMQSYQRSIKKEDKLLEQFEKDKDKHREKRLESEQSEKPKVPKIMQSQSMSNEDKMAGMTVSDGLIVNKNKIDPQTEAALETNVDNQGVAKFYEEDQSLSRVSLTKQDEERLNIHDEEKTADGKNDRIDTEQSNDEEINMTQDVQQLYFDKVKDHEENIEGYEPGELFKAHHSKLDPTVNYDHQKPESSSDNDNNQEKSLFEKHREQAEEHIAEQGRKSGIEKNISKSKNQQKLEKKINKKRQQF